MEEVGSTTENKMSANFHKVFVYGTLKTGEPNNHWFAKDNGTFTFLCHAKTVEKYPLVIGTDYNIPFLLYEPGVGYNVKGEVYEVDDVVLSNLDILEDHPTFYVREERDVQYSENNEIKCMKVWIYFIKKFKTKLLEKQMFECYSSKGDHGLEYVPSEESTLDDLNK